MKNDWYHGKVFLTSFIKYRYGNSCWSIHASIKLHPIFCSQTLTIHTKRVEMFTICVHLTHPCICHLVTHLKQSIRISKVHSSRLNLLPGLVRELTRWLQSRYEVGGSEYLWQTASFHTQISMSMQWPQL